MRTVDDDKMEKIEPHNMTIIQKIESQIRHYVVLKAQLSFLTGLFVLLILWLCNVKLWLVLHELQSKRQLCWGGGIYRKSRKNGELTLENC